MTDASEGLPGQGNFFDLMGDEGKEWQARQEEQKQNRITEAAQKKIDEHNKKYGPSEAEGDEKKSAENAEKIVDIEKITGTGKNGTITVGDAQKAINDKTPYTGYVPPQQFKEPDEYDRDRMVYYAGHNFEITDRTMKLEDVRKWLQETHFPEMSKERTKMEYDEDTGHIVPMLTGHRKGNDRVPDEIPSVLTMVPEKMPPSFYLLGRDGVYEVRTTQAGMFSAKIHSMIPMRESFVLNHPKIPADVLAAVVDAFKSEPEREMLAWIYYDRVTSLWPIVWPEQKRAPASVSSKELMVESNDAFIALVIHSHGLMPPFWSNQDNRDEIRTGLYAVVGHCDKPRPRIKLRYSVGGKYRPTPPHTVFQTGGELGDSWLRVVDWGFDQ